MRFALCAGVYACVRAFLSVRFSPWFFLVFFVPLVASFSARLFLICFPSGGACRLRSWPSYLAHHPAPRCQWRGVGHDVRGTNKKGHLRQASAEFGRHSDNMDWFRRFQHAPPGGGRKITPEREMGEVAALSRRGLGLRDLGVLLLRAPGADRGCDAGEVGYGRTTAVAEQLLTMRPGNSPRRSRRPPKLPNTWSKGGESGDSDCFYLVCAPSARVCTGRDLARKRPALLVPAIVGALSQKHRWGRRPARTRHSGCAAYLAMSRLRCCAGQHRQDCSRLPWVSSAVSRWTRAHIEGRPGKSRSTSAVRL